MRIEESAALLLFVCALPNLLLWSSPLAQAYWCLDSKLTLRLWRAWTLALLLLGIFTMFGLVDPVAAMAAGALGFLTWQVRGFCLQSTAAYERKVHPARQIAMAWRKPQKERRTRKIHSFGTSRHHGVLSSSGLVRKYS